MIWQSLDRSRLRRWLTWSVFLGKSEEETGTRITQQYPATSRGTSKYEVVTLESDDEPSIEEDRIETESTIMTTVQSDGIECIQID